MLPVCTVAVDGLPSESSSSSYPGPSLCLWNVSASCSGSRADLAGTRAGEMWHWCHLIYTRYVLSLLHDSCDYDLQEQAILRSVNVLWKLTTVSVCVHLSSQECFSYSGAGRQRLWSKKTSKLAEPSHRAHRLVRSLSLSLAPCSGRLWILSPDGSS